MGDPAATLVRGRRALAAGLLCLLLAACAVPEAPRAAPRPAWWAPTHGQSWQVQLDGGLDPGLPADIYDVDGVDAPAAALRTAKDSGARLVCYFNAGAWEDWRADAGHFPPGVIGAPLQGWPGEKWVDVRRLDVLLPLMAARMDACVRRGFDAVDPDNVDGYANASGFALSREDQLLYIRALARLAHERGLGFGLKNAVELVGELGGDVDFAVNEQCHEYDECAAYAPLLAAGKPVVVIEYDRGAGQLCGQVAQGMEVLFKPLDLGPARAAC